MQICAHLQMLPKIMGVDANTQTRGKEVASSFRLRDKDGVENFLCLPHLFAKNPCTLFVNKQESEKTFLILRPKSLTLELNVGFHEKYE